jgi:hypothetical protein
MDKLNLSWRGQPGSGKRTQLHKALSNVAAQRGISFVPQTRLFFTSQAHKNDNGAISTTAEDDTNESSVSEKDSFPYEFSYVHIGFDISRMSMQDKIYLKPILQKWGTGSQVLGGLQGHAKKILVFYHAHLFSTESCFLLHGLLEDSYGDISIWLTSELPVPLRLQDYFYEIPVHKNFVLSQTFPNWQTLFWKLFQEWTELPRPKLQDTQTIREFLYNLLMRNLRWTDCVHVLLDVACTYPLPQEKRKQVVAILAKQEATAAGQTIPSYRIPLLWETLFLELRSVLSKETLDGARPTDTPGESPNHHEGATTTVVRRATKSRGSGSAGKRSE